MKKFLLVCLLGILGFSQAKAQSHLELGFFFGPEIKNNSSVTGNIGLNAIYYYEIIEKLRVGAAVGFEYNWYEPTYTNIGYDSEFLTISPSVKFNFVKSWFTAMDLGYAKAFRPEYTDGINFKVKAGYSTRVLNLYLYYKNIFGADYDPDYEFLQPGDFIGPLGSVGIGLNFNLF